MPYLQALRLVLCRCFYIYKTKLVAGRVDCGLVLALPNRCGGSSGGYGGYLIGRTVVLDLESARWHLRTRCMVAVECGMAAALRSLFISHEIHDELLNRLKKKRGT